MMTTPAQTQPSLVSRLATYLVRGEGYKYRAVMRTGDKGQCVHLTPNVEGRQPTLCGIDRTDNGLGVSKYRRSTYFYTGAWKRLRALSFQGRDYLVSGGLLGWQPGDRHLCQKCLRALPKSAKPVAP